MSVQAKQKSRVCTCMPIPSPKDAKRLFGAKHCVLQKSLELAQRAVFLKTEAAWPNSYNIKIGFIGGTEAQRKYVAQVAAKWLKYMSLTFEYVEKLDDTDVRIAFDPDAGSWSFIGRQSQWIEKDRATMNLGWISADGADNAGDRGVILHEFGHMLGMAHEHQNPNINGLVTWKRDAVIKSLSGPPNNWSEDTIEYNVLSRYEHSNSLYTSAFDPESIMLYSFPAEWNEQGVTLNGNQSLSRQDKLAIAEMYPKGDGWQIDDFESDEEPHIETEKTGCCWQGVKAMLLRKK